MQDLLLEVIDRRWRAFWLIFFTGLCVASTLIALESRSVGHAMSAAGFVLLGIVTCRWMPIRLSASIANLIRPHGTLEPLPQALVVIALSLLFGGLLVRWVTG